LLTSNQHLSLRASSDEAKQSHFFPEISVRQLTDGLAMTERVSREQQPLDSLDEF